jgi:tRNA G10  N-methylase Trm11
MITDEELSRDGAAVYGCQLSLSRDTQLRYIREVESLREENAALKRRDYDRRAAWQSKLEKKDAELARLKAEIARLTPGPRVRDPLS